MRNLTKRTIEVLRELQSEYAGKDSDSVKELLDRKIQELEHESQHRREPMSREELLSILGWAVKLAFIVVNTLKD